jgi:hypothetical protein
MKLVKTIPHLGGLPEIFVFYCSRCKQAETKEQTVCRRPIGVVVGNERKAPTFWEVWGVGGWQDQTGNAATATRFRLGFRAARPEGSRNRQHSG